MSDQSLLEESSAAINSIDDESKPNVKPVLSEVKGKANVVGKFAELFGSGEHAKNTFIWVAMRWSFVIGCVISSALFVRALVFPERAPNLIDEIKSTWNIFVPIITLALGYAFGKGSE
ncbi:hypothetical protein [Herbaspirillum sp. GW103]|uniref:hypothetical protein n=1 Tax=Herbaspirillum sp. GW103 TaxID=1175306 RepID=UPI0006817392|nr:hypothetical protein [Herbaspirillum sp. GW103]